MFIASYFPQIFIQTFQLFYQLRSSVINMENQAMEADRDTSATHWALKKKQQQQEQHQS